MNELHSPLSLLMGRGLVRMAAKHRPAAASWMSWFFVSCLFHAVVDILTRYDNGPPLLWPLNGKLRFYSPVSYWDGHVPV